MQHRSIPSELGLMSAKILLGGVLIIILLAIGGAVLGGGGDAKPEAEYATVLGEEEAETTIIEIALKGPILTHAPDEESPFGSLSGGFAYGYEIKKKLKDAAENDEIDAVLLHVSTPGGTIVGSEAVHDGVLAVKEAGKPIVVYVDGLSASGGVWSTAAADAIYADHGSLVGSVGALAGAWMQYKEPTALDGGLFSGGVTTEGGVEYRVFKSPENKDIFNPFRSPTEREAADFDRIAVYFHDLFKAHVVEHRPVEMATLDDVGAMVLGNADAERLGYIDGTKTYEEVAEEIAGRLGADDWRLVKEKAEKGPFGLSIDLGGADGLTAFAAAENARACAELFARPSVVMASALSICR